MNVSAFFIRRPVGTSLLCLGLVLAGALALRWLPVAPLPDVNVPTVRVSATLPGASPAAMAELVAAPLERSLGRIAGVTDMSSTSVEGATTIRLAFALDRNIDGIARDVQGAINAARGALPPGMPASPSYRAATSADRPIMVLGLVAPHLTPSRMYAAAAGGFVQALARIPGVGQVDLVGGSPPAVRVDLLPPQMAWHGVSAAEVRRAIRAASPRLPLGSLDVAGRTWQLGANDTLRSAADVAAIVVAHADGAVVRLGQVAHVVDAGQDRFTAGRVGAAPGVLVLIRRNPGANALATVKRVEARLSTLSERLPPGMVVQTIVDRSTVVRASLRDAAGALALAVVLVVLVMLACLRDVRSALIASAAVPIALLGTLAAMLALGYSLDNLSLMALTIAIGFAVDDAVVVVENIVRHLELGASPRTAARDGAREIGLTVLSMSMVLIAVFIPLLFMGGYAGLFVREFAVTLAVMVVISLVVALTIVPMLCAQWLRAPAAEAAHGWLYRASSGAFAALARGYATSLDWVLGHAALTLWILLGVVGLNVYLFIAVPKGFFPRQDTGELTGSFNVTDGGSFSVTRRALDHFVAAVRSDPAVARVAGYAGRNDGSLFATLKPLSQRTATADAVAARIVARLGRWPGAGFDLRSVQDIQLGGRRSRASEQYTIEADGVAALREWVPRVQRALDALPEVRNVRIDTSGTGLDTAIDVDRDRAARLGVDFATVDGALHDAFAQSSVATLLTDTESQRIVMGMAPGYAEGTSALDALQLTAADGSRVPLEAFARYRQRTVPLGVDHQGLFVATTLAFDLAPGVALSQATAAVRRAVDRLALPMSVRGSFEGSARAFREVQASQPLLIAAALFTLFIVLGVLYESWAHPLTILSTLPSAGVGALLALLLFGWPFDVIAFIGVFALVGIVMKNAIMLVDFALVAQRDGGIEAREAIRRACLLRFRPILMTSLAVMLAAIPLALLRGNGAEMRQPLGIAIGGGLVMSQLLTLYTTPVVYLYLDRLGTRMRGSLRMAAARRAAVNGGNA